MSLSRQLFELLEQFRPQLGEGERIVTVVTEQCGCREGDKCGICGGRGFVFDALTVSPTPGEYAERFGG